MTFIHSSISSPNILIRASKYTRALSADDGSAVPGVELHSDVLTDGTTTFRV